MLAGRLLEDPGISADVSPKRGAAVAETKPVPQSLHGAPLADLSGCLARRLRLRLTLHYAGVNGLASSRNCLKIKFVAADLNDHERAVSVETRGHDPGALAKVAVAQLSGITDEKEIDAFFRLEPFVHVVVSRQNYVQSILLEEGHELLA